MDVEMLRQLGDGSVALDGGQSHLRLEGRRVVPAGSSAHGFSCSRRLSPLSGRNSTYRPVQISGAGSRNVQLPSLTETELKATPLAKDALFAFYKRIIDDVIPLRIIHYDIDAYYAGELE